MQRFRGNCSHARCFRGPPRGAVASARASGWIASVLRWQQALHNGLDLAVLLHVQCCERAAPGEGFHETTDDEQQHVHQQQEHQRAVHDRQAAHTLVAVAYGRRGLRVFGLCMKRTFKTM